MLVSGEAAHGRRVKPESGRSVHMAVNDDSEHLSLEPSQRRRLTEVQAVVNRAQVTTDRKIDESYLEDAGDVAVLALRPPHGELSDSRTASGETVLMRAIGTSSGRGRLPTFPSSPLPSKEGLVSHWFTTRPCS